MFNVPGCDIPKEFHGIFCINLSTAQYDINLADRDKIQTCDAEDT